MYCKISLFGKQFSQRNTRKCRLKSAGPFLSCDMKWKLGRATCQFQWIDVILFSLVPLIDVHVGWISSATHDPDKPREPPVVVLGGGGDEGGECSCTLDRSSRAREAAIHSCLPAEFINETSGRRRRRRRRRDFTGRTAHAHVVVHAGPSRNPSPPSRLTCFHTV